MFTAMLGWANESEIVVDCTVKLTEIHRSGRPRRLYSRLLLPSVARCPPRKCEHVIPYHVTQTDGRLLAREIYRRWSTRVPSHPVKYDWQRDRVIKVSGLHSWRSPRTGKWSEIPATTPALSWRMRSLRNFSEEWRSERETFAEARLRTLCVWRSGTKLKSIRIR